MARPEALLRWTERRRGLLDVGHHIIVDRAGIAHCIRPLDTMGAHTPGHNHDTISVVLIGGVNEEGATEDNFTAEQWNTVAYITAMALRSWPDIRLVHRHDIQRRKGDPARAIHEHDVEQAYNAALGWQPPCSPITDVIRVKKPRPHPTKEAPSGQYLQVTN